MSFLSLTGSPHMGPLDSLSLQPTTPTTPPPAQYSVDTPQDPLSSPLTSIRMKRFASDSEQAPTTPYSRAFTRLPERNPFEFASLQTGSFPQFDLLGSFLSASSQMGAASAVSDEESLMPLKRSRGSSLHSATEQKTLSPYLEKVASIQSTGVIHYQGKEIRLHKVEGAHGDHFQLYNITPNQPPVLEGIPNNKLGVKVMVEDVMSKPLKNDHKGMNGRRNIEKTWIPNITEQYRYVEKNYTLPQVRIFNLATLAIDGFILVEMGIPLKDSPQYSLWDATHIHDGGREIIEQFKTIFGQILIDPTYLAIDPDASNFVLLERGEGLQVALCDWREEKLDSDFTPVFPPISTVVRPSLKRLSKGNSAVYTEYCESAKSVSRDYHNFLMQECPKQET